jgi:hypothetical protein
LLTCSALARSGLYAETLPCNKATSEASAAHLSLKAYMRVARSSSSLGTIVEASTRGEAFGVESVGLWIGSVYTVLESKATGNLTTAAFEMKALDGIQLLIRKHLVDLRC